MKYKNKNIRKIKNFNDELCNNNNIINNDIFLLSSENFLNLYNIYNIDDLNNYVKKIHNNSLSNLNYDIQIEHANTNQFLSLKNIFECWIFNNIKILKKHDSYFLDICLFIIENNPKLKEYNNLIKKKLSSIKKYISKLLQAYIYTIEYPDSGYIKYPIIKINSQFLPILLEKIENNLLTKIL